MTDEQEVEDITEVDRAFIDSENHSLNGEKLQPYSLARKVAAQAMGLFYGHVDEADRDRFRREKVYPGALRDMIIVLWLCTLKDDDEIDAASRAPKAAVKRAYAWAETEGVANMDHEKFWKAYILFHDIMGEVAASQVRAEKKSGPDSETMITIPT